MNTVLPASLISIFLLLMPNVNFGQAPDLGSASDFAVFTSVGAFTNIGPSSVMGDIGTGVGAFAGFPPGVVLGEIHVADIVSAIAAVDVELAYSEMSTITCGPVLGTLLGNGQILTPDVYCLGAASTLDGNLFLDGQGDPNAIFIFKIDGALSTTTNSNVVLINGATFCNIYWQINGAVALGENSGFQGTILANGAISSLDGAALFGRALSRAGAINMHGNFVNYGLPLASTITASGAIIFCEGGSVVLSGNNNGGVWSSGETSASITVTTSTDHFVTNTNECGSIVSNHIIVSVNPLPICSISGDLSICEGQSTELCVPPGAASYLWSNGENTNCINVSLEGGYSVTVTSANGCSNVCNETVVINSLPLCNITGDDILCEGQSTELCVPPGAASYLWSTGESTNCITVDMEGTYSVTITDANGCTSECSETVVVNPLPLCEITGGLIVCLGESTELCVPPGAASYLWSTGESTNCITVDMEGTYSVTITDANGCTSECSETVVVNPLPICSITGDDLVCEGEPIELCAISGATSYLWNTGATTTCITVSVPGTYSVTLTDANGCSSMCMKEVILDNIPPVVSCPIDVTIECDETTLPINTGFATATDNCILPPIVVYSDIITAGVCPQEFTITRTWTATDGAGNTVSCVQTITIEDNSLPLIVCPADTTVECIEQVPAVNIDLVVTSDNCGGAVTVTHEGDVITNQICENDFILTRTYRAVDQCDNTDICTQVITVFDNMPPVVTLTDSILANGDTIFVQCFGQDPTWDLPLFDETSVIVTDNCAGDVTIVFSQELENEGNCLEGGYINLYRLTWAAADVCGNDTSLVLFLALIDTIPPVIFGVPEDITVNCADIPELPFEVFATDGCLCACVVFSEETVLELGCQDGQIIQRTWTAKDECGNQSTATQTITLIDNEGPNWQLLLPEISYIPNGAIMEYACNEGGIPEIFNNLPTDFVSGPGTCGAAFVINFNIDTIYAANCEDLGYLEQRTYLWTGIDECGNLSEMTFSARLIDNQPPVLTGVPDTTCISDPLLDDIVSTDACGESFLQFLDVNIPNPCGDGMAIQRIYMAQDECGNVARDTAILLPVDQTPPVIRFINLELIGMDTGDILILDCAAHDGLFTAFSIEDISVEDSCTAGITLDFSEELISLGDCTIDGVVATVKLQWTATDACGNFSELVVVANIVDESNPVFVDFNPDITIGCNDEMPEIQVFDNCGETSMVMSDSIINGDCAFEYVVQRMVTATDVCGNSITQLQTIHVGDGSGPIIEGVEELICDDLSIPDVTAYDACAGVFVEVTMEEVTLDLPCNGLVIERIWTATDSCGNINTIRQIIIVNDQTPPEIVFPSVSIIPYFYSNGNNLIYAWQTELIDKLNALNANSVFVTDDCNEGIVAVFTVETNYSDDCKEDGYFEQRVYTWTATDICGNTASVSFAVYIIDDTPPIFQVFPADITVVCAPLPPIPDVYAEDLAEPVTMTYSETTEPGAVPGEFIVTRKWVATDACGNSSEYIQRITWIPDTFLECNIILPPVVDCNTHGVEIGSIIIGSNGPLTYHWEIVGEDCFIQGGQGTPEIIIYIGWSSAKIILTVTDEFGCASMCMITVPCQFSIDSPFNTQSVIYPVLGAKTSSPSPANLGKSTPHLQQLKLWPFPANQTVNLSFETSMEGEVTLRLMNLLGQVIHNSKINAVEGLNEHMIKVAHLREGSYLVQLNSEKEMLTRIVVIMHNQ